MKYFVVIAAVLALLAITHAQDETNLAEPSPVPPSDPIPPRPGRPGRPGRRPFGNHFVRPQPNEDSNQQSDSENPEDNSPQRIPQRQQVLLNFNVDFGKRNNITDNHQDSTSTTTPAPAPA